MSPFIISILYYMYIKNVEKNKKNPNILNAWILLKKPRNLTYQEF